MNGDEGMLKTLLERDDINPDKAGRWDRTPLWLAANYGHEGVVRILLARDDVNPDQGDRFGETPSSQAAAKGHEGIAKMLLERSGIPPGKTDTESGQEMLLGATRKTLLERDDIDPDKAN